MDGPESDAILETVRAHLGSSSADHSIGKIHRWRETIAAISNERERTASVRRIAVMDVEGDNATVELDATVTIHHGAADGRPDVQRMRYSGAVDLVKTDGSWRIADLPLGRGRITEAIVDLPRDEVRADELSVRPQMAWITSAGVSVVVEITNAGANDIALAGAAFRGKLGRWRLAAVTSRAIPAGQPTRLMIVARSGRPLAAPVPNHPDAVSVVLRTTDGRLIEMTVPVAEASPARITVRERVPWSMRVAPFVALTPLIILVVAFGALFSWRDTGWLLLGVAGIWAFSFARRTRLRSFPSRRFVAIVGTAAAAGAALVLANGGLPFRPCSSPTGTGVARTSDSFVEAIARHDSGRAQHFLGHLPGSYLPTAVGTPTPSAIRRVIATRRRSPNSTACAFAAVFRGIGQVASSTVCFSYRLAVTIPGDTTGSHDIVVGLGCEGSRWRVESIDY